MDTRSRHITNKKNITNKMVDHAYRPYSVCSSLDPLAALMQMMSELNCSLDITIPLNQKI